jgi:hypothetical protein
MRLLLGLGMEPAEKTKVPAGPDPASSEDRKRGDLSVDFLGRR